MKYSKKFYWQAFAWLQSDNHYTTHNWKAYSAFWDEMCKP